MNDKAPDAFRTISEAAEELDLPQHVLRFWETRFPQIKPLKRGGGRRYYRPDDLAFLRGLKSLLHDERYTIKGVQKIIKEQGVKAIASATAALPAAEMASADAASVENVAAAATMRLDLPRLHKALNELAEFQRLASALKDRLAALPSPNAYPIRGASRSVAQPG
ncbi:MAG: MerR family transcriptional regulator [Beijerinckiaceae bacterium]